MDDLTEQQARFVAEFVANGGDGQKACIAAGYAAKSASQEVYRLLRKEHVLRSIRSEEMRVLGTMSAQALFVLNELMRDPEVSPAVRLDAAKTTLDRSGFAAARTPGQPVGTERPLNELDVNELFALVGAIESIQGLQGIAPRASRPPLLVTELAAIDTQVTADAEPDIPERDGQAETVVESAAPARRNPYQFVVLE